jgi:hypothetical protein
MEQNTHMAQDGSEETQLPLAQTHTKKMNNPKSALSYSEIIQLRQQQNKHGGGGGSGGGSAVGDNPSTSATAATGNEPNKYFCNNCNRTNHVYNNCRAPITSIGVIAFRCGESGPEFLMIRRRDSFGFVDFIRGKYSLNDEAYIQRIIDEMTVTEKSNLMRLTFDQLWRLLWGDSTRGSQDKNEELENLFNPCDFREARARFEKMFIQKKLSEFDGNVSKTAEAMGMERSHLYRKMRQLDLISENEKSTEEE